MTNEELIKGLRYCGNSRKTGCKGCPAWDKPMDACFQIVTAAADALEAAEKRIATYQSDVADLEQREKELNDVLNERARLITELQSRIAELEQIAAHYEQSAKDWWKEACEYKAQIPKEGEWIPVTNGRGGHECSLCHGYAPTHQNGDENLSDYCPNCGARMNGGQE